MRLKLRVVHRYVSLAVAALWLLQAGTGLLLVFHWELDDLAVRGPASTLDAARFGAFLEHLQAANPHRMVLSAYANEASAGRFDILLANQAGYTDVLRVDGKGTILRERPWNYDYSRIGILQIATYLHQTLFLHQFGTWLIGLSGIVLVTNLVLALRLAWPKVGYWRQAVIPRRGHSTAARLYGWHRALGLWLGIPTLVLVCAGVLMAYEEPLESWFDDARPPPSLSVAAAEPVTLAASAANAIATALRIYPGKALASLDLPTAYSPWFVVRLTHIGDVSGASGKTIIYLSSRSGRVLANYNSSRLPLKTRFWDALYATHTGKIGGIAGRVAAALVAAWLLTMIGLGFALWLRRRSNASVSM